MCEKTKTFTKEHFEEIFGGEEDVYYVYHLDDDGVMHFMAESYDITEGAFTTDFNNASIITKDGAKIALLLGGILLDYELHVVHVSTKVTWDC